MPTTYIPTYFPTSLEPYVYVVLLVVLRQFMVCESKTTYHVIPLVDEISLIRSTIQPTTEPTSEGEPTVEPTVLPTLFP